MAVHRMTLQFTLLYELTNHVTNCYYYLCNRNAAAKILIFFSWKNSNVSVITMGVVLGESDSCKASTCIIKLFYKCNYIHAAVLQSSVTPRVVILDVTVNCLLKYLFTSRINHYFMTLQFKTEN